MGWNGTFVGGGLPRGKKRMELALEYCGLDPEAIVDAAIVGSTVYAAYRSSSYAGMVLGCVILTQWSNGWLYTKAMDETTGPYKTECPKRIIDKLSSLNQDVDPHFCARKWRVLCLHERTKPKLSELPLYTRIRLNNPQKTELIIEPGEDGRRRYVGWGIHASAQAINSWGFEVVEMGEE